jgi:hypothetical protein
LEKTVLHPKQTKTSSHLHAFFALLIPAGLAGVDYQKVKESTPIPHSTMPCLSSYLSFPFP